MEVSFFVRSKKPFASIRVTFTAGRLVKCYAKTDIMIPVEWWDSKRGRLKVMIRVDRKREIESRLQEIEEKICERFLKDSGKRIIDSKWLSSIVGSRNEAIGFFGVFDDYVSKLNVSPGRLRSYVPLRGKLERYEKIMNITLSVNVGSDFLREFEHFIRNEQEYVSRYPLLYTKDIKPRGQNYVNDNIKKLRAFFIHVRKDGLTNENPFDNYKIKSDRYADPVALSLEEVDRVFNADVPEYLIKIRDMFILHCSIGLRVSDLVQMKRSNIIDGVLTYVASKGIKSHQKTVFVPLSKRALEIIERYNEPVKLFPCMNIDGANGYNKGIKLLLKHAGINRLVITINSCTGHPEQKPLCEIASSHTARKTFISCVLNKTRSEYMTASMTDHVDGSKAFSRYTSVQIGTLKDIIKDVFD